MHPFYFGDSRKQLFGVFHPPSSRPQAFAALLCQPLHGEYIQSHRAMRALANSLAKEGVPVLRFDYYGTGDSAGDAAETTLRQCYEDIGTAARELKDTSGASHLVLAGLRLGASLAATVATKIHEVHSIVLWDPVVDGSEYLGALKSKYETFLRSRRHRSIVTDETRSYGAYPISEELRRELAELNLTNAEIPTGRRVFFARSEDSPSYAAYLQHLHGGPGNVVSDLVPGQRIWEAKLLESNELVPTTMLRRITSWIVR